MTDRPRRMILTEGHWLVTEEGQKCPACLEPFRVGEAVTLVPVGPGPDPRNRKLAREGGPYMAVAVPVHYPCATGED